MKNTIKKRNNKMMTYSSQSNQRGGFFGFLFMLIIIAAMVMFTLYVIQLDRTIVSKFEGKRWNIPAKVYSKPLELYEGAAISQKHVDQWLKLLNYKNINDQNQTGSYSKNNSTYNIHTRGFTFNKDDIEPEQIITLSFSTGHIKKITSNNNSNKILRLEPISIGGIYPDNNEDRTVVTMDEVPQTLIDALIATEDRNFYKHYGVSIRGIARAFVNNFSGKAMQGGSTLTQQLVKNFYLNSDRTLKRKVNEALMALLLEAHYAKKDILHTYINEINLGQSGSRSINGFGLASEFYFNRPLNELSITQQALLVGMAKGPSLYNPRRNPENALARRNTVLNNMLVMNTLTQEQYDLAITQPLNVIETPVVGKSLFPDFLDVVKRELYSVYYAEDLKNEGLTIITTLDPLVQSAADSAVDKKVAQLRKLNTHTKNLESSLVSANPATGELVAIVGSGGEFTGFNRAIDAKRQVGSLLKPIIYLNALESGKYNLASLVDDSPITVKLSNGQTWSPKNYGGRSHENVGLTKALASSYNQAAVRIGLEFGVDSLVNKLRKMGVKSEITPYPSTLLGSNSLTPMEVVGLYQVFATGGFRTPLHSIRSVVDDKGIILQRAALHTERSLDPKANFLINHALQQVVQDGTAKRALNLGKDLNLAGKTGTTNDYKDAWFAGYSGNYVSVVWVGRDDNKSIALSGTSGALPVWIDFMNRLDLTPVNLTQPEGIEWLWLENNDGRLSNEECMEAKYLPVLSTHLPTEASECAVAIYQAKIDAEEAQKRAEELAILEQQARENIIDFTNGNTPNNTTEGENNNSNPSTGDTENTDKWYDSALKWF